MKILIILLIVSVVGLSMVTRHQNNEALKDTFKTQQQLLDHLDNRIDKLITILEERYQTQSKSQP